jgi:ABC-type polysaccharide/polyol phosphate transport system ATPase subunit
MAIIEVENLTKEYRLGAMQGIKQTLLNTAARLAGKKVEERPLFKALDDVSFSVEQGEVVGIIGHNGAGKSTLLKMLAKISTPTRGSVKVNGRIAPLIEVGAGFVPDFTGRENVYLNGAILGMSKQEIDKKFDEIVDFAEMAEFIDTPVKRYSSGMQVKLAFSVATSIEAEILIVDEVLAVGDIAFQRKCLVRMESFMKNEGRTVLIVGHNIRQLERICTRMILLKHGRIECDGEPGKASKQFLDETTLKPEHVIENKGILPHFDSGDIEVLSVEIITDEYKEGTPVIALFADMHIRIRVRAHQVFNEVEMNFGLHNPEMVFISKSSTSLLGQSTSFVDGENVIDILVKKIALCAGTYGIGFAMYDWSRRPLWGGNGIVWFTVEAPSDYISRLPPSTQSYMPALWAINQRQSEAITYAPALPATQSSGFTS